MIPSKNLRIASTTLQVVVVAVACWWLSPLNTRTVFSAASEYALATGFGPYAPLVYSHVQQRPFEICKGANDLHVELMAGVEKALPSIEASSRFEPIRLFRLIRAFNRETQTFYTTPCAGEWSYFYWYGDYQSNLLKAAPMIWIIDVLHRSEIYVMVAMVLGSWFGIFSLFWVTKRLTGSVVVGFVSLGVLGLSVNFFSSGLYADFRLNLFNTLSLVGIAQFLCDLPCEPRRGRRWAIELAAALAFAGTTLLLVFLRLPSTKLDAIVVLACLVAVAAIRRDRHVLRRAILVAVMVFAVQWPFKSYSAELLGPLSAVNSANSEEFKVASVVQFLTERPSHFGNFILDFNFTWMFDADFYLRQLSQVPSLHHGFPAWGQKFLKETVLHHPTEIPIAWGRRFVAQIVHHEPLTHGLYRDHQVAGTAIVWLGVTLICFIVLRGRRASSSWPLLGLVMWEVFGLHTFLALMHVHAVYLIKGIPLLWCALPSIAFVAGREGRALASTAANWSWPRRLEGRRLGMAIAVGVAVIVVGWWAAREFRKEMHVTRIWRAVHVGQYHQDAYLSPDDLMREVDAIRDLGGDDPGVVSMYGAWALFGYTERLGNYAQFAGQPISADYVKGLTLDLYRRALAEAPDNPHFYPYAQYFNDPDRMHTFRTALDRFPDHPWAVLMSWVVATQDSSLTSSERTHYLAVYEESVRRQLRESVSYRPGFQETPPVSAPVATVSAPDGQFVTLLPGEVARVGPFHTYGTDRLAVGVYLKVTDGQVTVGLDEQPQATLAEDPVLVPSDAVAYRAWHFSGLEADRASSRERLTALELRAGPQGARFLVRDLYPLVENPRWFR